MTYQVVLLCALVLIMVISAGRKVFSRERAINTDSKNPLSHRQVFKSAAMCPHSTGS